MPTSQEVTDLLAAHASKRFDLSELNGDTQKALMGCGISISASGTIPGLTIEEVDALLSKRPMDAQQRMAVKLDLQSKGVMLHKPINRLYR